MPPRDRGRPDPGDQRPLSRRRRPSRAAAPVAEEASSRSAGVLTLRKKPSGSPNARELGRAQLEDAHVRPERRHLASRPPPPAGGSARGRTGRRRRTGARGRAARRAPRRPTSRRARPGGRGERPGRAAGPPPRRGPGGPPHSSSPAATPAIGPASASRSTTTGTPRSA